MDQMYVNSRMRVFKDKVLHVKRRLSPLKSAIYVQEGQEVSISDVLGEGQGPTGFRTINLAKELGVSPKKASSFLKRPLGQIIYQGELLAKTEAFWGLRKKLLLSPVDGIVDFYDDKTGGLRIKLLPKRTKLISGVYGIVDHVDYGKGVITLRTRATLIYGVFGVGKEREGILKILGSKDSLISSKQILPQMSGQVLVGGSIVFLDALEKSVSLGINGFISGGIDLKDYQAIGGSDPLKAGINFFSSAKKWSDVGLTVMITEGFGSIQIGDDIFSVLKEYDGKFVILDGNLARLILPNQTPDSMMYIRRVKLPEVIEPETLPESGLAAVKAGAVVRVLTTPFLGMQGEVETIDKTVTRLPSGIVTWMVTVSTPQRKIRVPYQNLEVIG